MPSLSGPILLLGGGGMLGRAWRQRLEARGLAYEAPSHEALDITDRRAVRAFLTARHRLVINCAAWTDVDSAQANPQAANEVNGRAVGELIKRCAEVGALLVHYSTDYVFQGDGRPLAVDESREPLNAYGRSKEIGEELLDAFPTCFLLIRTSWLYAPWGHNFVRTIARLAREKPLLKVVNDQRGRPTSAEHLVAVSLALLERGCTGPFHATDGGECTWFEFACQIVALTAPGKCRVEPCTSAEFPRPASRPAYSVLDLTPTESLLGPMRHWKENLADVIRRLE